MRVFIQNEAGSTQKNRHNEQTLEFSGSEIVSRPYPFPYGFIIGVAAADGLNVDCFVITQQPFRSGEIVDCEVIGLMEQVEDGVVDHNVLAKLPDESGEVSSEVQAVLSAFVLNVFRHVQGKQIAVGRFLPAREATAHIQRCLDAASASVSVAVSEWAKVPVFGRLPADGLAIVRPSAYGIIVDSHAHVAIVSTPQGCFLPGGGIQPGEQPDEAIVREAGEECGLHVQLGSWSRRAIDFIYSEAEHKHFEKHSIFVEARPTGRDGRLEADYELRWRRAEEAVACLTHPSHRWAVARWAEEHGADSRITGQWT